MGHNELGTLHYNKKKMKKERKKQKEINTLNLYIFQTSRKELLALDFEGVLKFFRVTLPKKYRLQDHSNDLLHVAVTIKVSLSCNTSPIL